MEGAGGEKCYRACQPFHGKAPLGTRESTRPTSNGVNFRDGIDNGSRYGRYDGCRIDAVPIGRDPMSRARSSEWEGRDVYCYLQGEYELTEMGADSRAAGSDAHER